MPRIAPSTKIREEITRVPKRLPRAPAVDGSLPRPV